MPVGDAEAIRRLTAEVAAADGVAPLSGHVLEALDTLDQQIMFGDDDEPVGVAVFPAADPGELFVAPGSRRRGLGRVLALAALERSGGVWAHGDLAEAAALARDLGLVRGRVLLQMRRRGAVGGLPPAIVPPVVTIRTFHPGEDEDAFLGVNARAFAWHPEQGRLDRAGLDAEMAQDWFDPAGFFLAVDDSGTVLAYHWTKVHPVDPTPAAGAGRAGPIGEVYVLGVDPLTDVRGLGSALTRVGLEHLAARGLATVMLYVEGDNERAIGLYRRFGFDISGTDVVYRRP